MSQTLRGRLIHLLLALTCTVAFAPARTVQAGGDDDLATLEVAALEGINAERRAAGLPPLVASSELSRLARAYSRDMAERRFFSHSDPDGLGVVDRTTKAGISWKNVGENIARNRGFKDPAAVAVREWMKSEGHRGNVLDSRFEETGIGAWVGPDRTVYFTQIFLRRSQQ
jgi:uncharacterized protein YkwD